MNITTIVDPETQWKMGDKKHKFWHGHLWLPSFAWSILKDGEGAGVVITPLSLPWCAVVILRNLYVEFLIIFMTSNSFLEATPTERHQRNNTKTHTVHMWSVNVQSKLFHRCGSRNSFGKGKETHFSWLFWQNQPSPAATDFSRNCRWWNILFDFGVPEREFE